MIVILYQTLCATITTDILIVPVRWPTWTDPPTTLLAEYVQVIGLLFIVPSRISMLTFHHRRVQSTGGFTFALVSHHQRCLIDEYGCKKR